MNKQHATITPVIQNALLDETGSICANPVCQNRISASDAHFAIVFQPGVLQKENLLALCHDCFLLQKGGEITPPAIQTWKILRLAISGEIKSAPMGLKLGAIRNYPGLQPFFPDEYFDFPFIGGNIYLNVKESRMMLARALGVYEPDKTQTICSLLKPGQVFIDVGCNKGDFSLLAAKIIGKDGSVLAFEPEPDNCQWIEKSIKLNNYGSIKLFQLALADKNEDAQLYLGEKSGWHSLISSHGNTRKSTIEVKKRTLDSILEEVGDYHVDMIKIDVEGAEMEVLKGASKMFDNNPKLTVLLDLHPHMGVDPVAVCKFLSDRNFNILKMKAPHTSLGNIDNTTTEILAVRQ